MPHERLPAEIGLLLPTLDHVAGSYLVAGMIIAAVLVAGRTLSRQTGRLAERSVERHQRLRSSACAPGLPFVGWTNWPPRAVCPTRWSNVSGHAPRGGWSGSPQPETTTLVPVGNGTRHGRLSGKSSSPGARSCRTSTAPARSASRSWGTSGAGLIRSTGAMRREHRRCPQRRALCPSLPG